MVFFFHGMAAADKKLCLDPLDGQAVLLAGFAGRQRPQPLPTAADARVRQGGHHVAAAGADPEPKPVHISADPVIGRQLPGEQLAHIHLQRLRQLRQQAQFRAAQAPLPFADGLVTDAQALRQLKLGQPPLPPQPVYQFTDLSVIHCFSLLLPSL